ncbi:hypothetical protein F4X33_04910 [Candidatus Poribacteria bacterium]|nr:hypothetical protein [Candidatus Poribacteria bacterium]
MFQHNDCTIESLTMKIDSIIKIETPQVLAECDPAFTEQNRLKTILGESYYKRGILLAERRDKGDVGRAIYDLGQVINLFNLFRAESFKPLYLSDAYERRAQLYEEIGCTSSAERNRIMAEQLQNRGV